jgi:hypothetical protein
MKSSQTALPPFEPGCQRAGQSRPTQLYVRWTALILTKPRCFTSRLRFAKSGPRVATVNSPLRRVSYYRRLDMRPYMESFIQGRAVGEHGEYFPRAEEAQRLLHSCGLGELGAGHDEINVDLAPVKRNRLGRREMRGQQGTIALKTGKGRSLVSLSFLAC